MGSQNYFFTPKIASFAALATRNFTTFLALIWIFSPVAGLRPTRALRLTSTSLPRPGMVNESLACLYASAASCSRISPACFLVMLFFSAIADAIWNFVSALPHRKTKKAPQYSCLSYNPAGE